MKKIKKFLVEYGITTKNEAANCLIVLITLFFNVYMVMNFHFLIHPLYFIGINLSIIVIGTLINRNEEK